MSAVPSPGVWTGGTSEAPLRATLGGEGGAGVKIRINTSTMTNNVAKEVAEAIATDLRPNGFDIPGRPL
jgi:ABC-type transport system substrate-binding protein